MRRHQGQVGLGEIVPKILEIDAIFADHGEMLLVDTAAVSKISLGCTLFCIEPRAVLVISCCADDHVHLALLSIFSLDPIFDHSLDRSWYEIDIVLHQRFQVLWERDYGSAY